MTPYTSGQEERFLRGGGGECRGELRRARKEVKTGIKKTDSWGYGA